MPDRCDLSEFLIPEGSALYTLLTRMPDIEALQFTDGEYLLRQGDKTVETYIVISGGYVVEQAISGKGRQGKSTRTLAAVVAGLDNPTFVGEMAYLGGGFRSASVRSAGNTIALKLGKDHVKAIIDGFSYFTSVLCRQLTERLEEANQALEILSLESALSMIPAGEIVIQADAPADTLYQLVDGALRRPGDGDDREIGPEDLSNGFIDPGPFFCNGTYTETFTTTEPSTIVAIAKASKQAVIRNYPDLLLNLFKEKCQEPVNDDKTI
ncbi:MAG: cyclic nucleotide-binding domain-containing protein [Thermodesulfobacteriota bacterium]|nr:cyclic nucleotide-binding domain-containing protein [Thermodesulfobacteriota bacterium]